MCWQPASLNQLNSAEGGVNDAEKNRDLRRIGGCSYGQVNESEGIDLVTHFFVLTAVNECAAQHSASPQLSLCKTSTLLTTCCLHLAPC